MTVRVRPLETRDAEACDGVVLSLPYHFGDEAGRADCAAAVRAGPGFVVDEDDAVVGFVTYEHRFEDATEITWLAVRADRRRHGLGRLLVERVAGRAIAEGRRFLIALTVSPSDGPDDIADGYDATRAFYRSRGFAPLRDFPGYWDSDTPVIMVRVLG